MLRDTNKISRVYKDDIREARFSRGIYSAKYI